MVVKHESEWFGGSGHQKWTAFFQDYGTLRIDFAKKWLDDMEWMSQVAPFTSDQSVWHMHPVVFLDALRKKKTGWVHSPFADLLASVESKNDYTAYNRTWPHPNPIHSEAHYNTHLTSMTLNEVMKAQAHYDMFATGRYQIIPEALEDAVKTLRLNIDALYNEMIQDKIFEEYLIKVKRKTNMEYLEGDGNVDEAIYAWAMEFSSAGVRKRKAISKGRGAHNEGVSYYSGDGLNRANLMPDEMIEVLKESKNEKN